jgi:hypothetical protein
MPPGSPETTATATSSTGSLLPSASSATSVASDEPGSNVAERNALMNNPRGPAASGMAAITKFAVTPAR